jgi:hypothetical protein
MTSLIFWGEIISSWPKSRALNGGTKKMQCKVQIEFNWLNIGSNGELFGIE